MRDNDLDLIDKTLASGKSADADERAYGRTPLHKAAYYSGEPGVIESIIERGADVNARDKRPDRVAPRGAEPSQRRAGAPPGRGRGDTLEDVKHGWTPMHLAVIAGNVRGARMLVERGADPGALDRSGANVRTLLEENDVDPASVLSGTGSLTLDEDAIAFSRSVATRSSFEKHSFSRLSCRASAHLAESKISPRT